MARLERVQEFVRKYSDEISPLPIDPVALLVAWDNQYNDLKEFIRNLHKDLVLNDQETLREHYDGGQETYYLDAVGQWAADQDDASLMRAVDLLEQNALDSYIHDKYFRTLCYEVLREEVKPTTIPDDTP